MTTEFKDSLNEDEALSVSNIYGITNNVSATQLIGFPFMLNKNNRLKYVLLKNIENELVGYCIITESMSNIFPFIKTAKIQYGPVCRKSDDEVFLIYKIYDHYRESKFALIQIQLRHIVSQESEKILADLSKKISFTHKYDKHNRCTLHVDLTNTLEHIQANFSSLLIKNIRSAINKKVEVRTVTSKTEIKEFASLYTKMGNKRGKTHYSESYIEKISNFLISSNSGFILCSFLGEKMIGGGLFVNQAERVEYFIGATDPDFKKIPSSHLLLFEAIKLSQKDGRKIFDMGGVGYYAKPSDQIHNINLFKENFSRNYVFYTKLMYIHLNPYYITMLNALSFIKTLLT